jgi:soluble lytic murein transglycosylase-like protein
MPNLAIVLTSASLSLAQISLAAEHFSLVAAIAQVESGGNFQARGDYNKKTGEYLAHGAYQLHKDAWVMGGGSLEHWPEGAYDPVESTTVAMRYIAWIERYLTAKDVLPTAENIYSAWNVGPSRFVNHFHARISECPKTTQRACEKITKFLQQ